MTSTAHQSTRATAAHNNSKYRDESIPKQRRWRTWLVVLGALVPSSPRCSFAASLILYSSVFLSGAFTVLKKRSTNALTADTTSDLDCESPPSARMKREAATARDSAAWRACKRH